MAKSKKAKATSPTVISFVDFVNDDISEKSKKPSCVVEKSLSIAQSNNKQKEPVLKRPQVEKRKHSGSPNEKNKHSKRKKTSEEDVVFLGKFLKSDMKQSTIKSSKSKQNVHSKDKKSKRRRSSTDVIEIKVIKPPMHHALKPKPSTGASTLHNFIQEETPLWVEKHKPKAPSDLLVSQNTIAKLQTWLQQWKEAIKKETVSLQRQAEKEKNKKKKKASGSSSDSDFKLSDEESRDSGLCNTFVLVGPTGCGKTVTAYTCAGALGFKVLEINASCHRSYKQVMSQLQEATQSHLVWKQCNKEVAHTEANQAKSSFCKGMDSFFKKKSSNSCSQVQHSSRDQNSLILFDEVEAVLDNDKGFWSAVQSFANMTKRPILLTTTNPLVLQNLSGSFITSKLNAAKKMKLCELLNAVATKEKKTLNSDDCERAVMSMKCDMRQAIMSLQFWTQSTDGKTTLTPKQKSKNGFRKSTSSGKVINNITAKSWGVADILHSSKCFHEHLTEVDKNSLKSLEESVAHLITFNVPDMVLCNRFELLGAEYPVNKRSSLVIHVQEDLIPTYERGNFTHNHPDIDVDFLSLAYNRPFVSRETVPAYNEDSLESNHSIPFQQNGGSDAECILANHSYCSAPMSILSEYLDTISVCDQLGCRYLSRYAHLARNAGSARLLDGLSDHTVTKVCDPPSSTARAVADLQASLRVRNLHKTQTRMKHQPIPLKPPSDVRDNPPRYSQELLERLSYCGDAKPRHAASRSFNLDYLPALRSVCRTEEKRKAAKTSRRFFHYLDQIQLFPLPEDVTNLAGEFIERVDPDKKI